MEKLDPLGEKHKMRLLDHGGYYEFSNLQIRDIRPEHLTLPFQAIEIFLANIRPKNGNYTLTLFSSSYKSYIFIHMRLFIFKYIIQIICVF